MRIIQGGFDVLLMLLYASFLLDFDMINWLKHLRWKIIEPSVANKRERLEHLWCVGKTNAAEMCNAVAKLYKKRPY